MSKSKNLFISFEGGEGTGKTTQIALLASFLKQQGFSTVVTREPGGSILANRIRDLILDPKMHGLVPLAELFLYEASRAQHLADIIAPALQKQQVVICDRFTDSSLVYQGVARGLPMAVIRKLNTIATNSLTPNLTIILDMDPKLGLARAGKRGKLDRLESETLKFHRAVRLGYLALAKAEPKRFAVLSATESKEKIHKQIVAIVRKKFRC